MENILCVKGLEQDLAHRKCSINIGSINIIMIRIRGPGAGQAVCSVIPCKSSLSFPISNRRTPQRSPEREVGEPLLFIEPLSWGGWLGAQQAVMGAPEQKGIWSACRLAVKRCTLGKWLRLAESQFICQLGLAGPSHLNIWEERYDSVYSVWTEESFLFLISPEGKNRCKGLLGLSFYNYPILTPISILAKSIEEWFLVSCLLHCTAGVKTAGLHVPKPAHSPVHSLFLVQ